MIKTRLIEQVPSSKKYIALTVLAQWLKTVANIVMIFILSNLLAQILDGKAFDFKGLFALFGRNCGGYACALSLRIRKFSDCVFRFKRSEKSA